MRAGSAGLPVARSTMPPSTCAENSPSVTSSDAFSPTCATSRALTLARRISPFIVARSIFICSSLVSRHSTAPGRAPLGVFARTVSPAAPDTPRTGNSAPPPSRKASASAAATSRVRRILPGPVSSPTGAPAWLGLARDMSS